VEEGLKPFKIALSDFLMKRCQNGCVAQSVGEKDEKRRG
jgi:hypothetical protein